MKMKSVQALVAAMAASFALSASASTLLGDTVSVELTDSTFGSFGSRTVIAAPGDDANYFGNQFLDFDFGIQEDIFAVRSNNNFCGITCGGGTIRWMLSDLDFADGSTLTGIEIVQNYSNLHVESLSADAVTLAYLDTSIPPSVYLQVRFLTTAQVPVPGTVALMALGLFFLRVARRGTT